MEGWLVGWLVGWFVSWMDGWMDGWINQAGEPSVFKFSDIFFFSSGPHLTTSIINCTSGIPSFVYLNYRVTDLDSTTCQPNSGNKEA